MLAKRIILCLDCDLAVPQGRVVKGKKFRKLRYAGEPSELALRYYEEGADELIILDITASVEKRQTMREVIKRTSENVFIPICAGGGIRSVADVQNLLKAGADKCAVNTSAVEFPGLISKAARQFGSQCIVVAIDAKWNGKFYEVFTYGGRKPTGLDAVQWAKCVELFGAGEILLTSIDADGMQKGFDLRLTDTISSAVSIPVIASGGASSPKDFVNVFRKTNASAALAAGIFHFDKFKISDVKQALESAKIPVRL